jgi:hypothetical protein
MSPFEHFFANDFQRLLDRTSVPGMGDASWDRRAAWLVWRVLQQSPTPLFDFEKNEAGVFEMPADHSSNSVFD